MQSIMKNTKKLITSIVLLLVVAAPLAAVAPASAQLFNDSKEEACKGVQLDDASCDVAGKSAASGILLSGTVRTAINILSTIIGIVAVIMVMIGGFKYVTSGGDSAGVNSAKNTILFAVVGLVIVALAQVLVRFVFKEVTTIE